MFHLSRGDDPFGGSSGRNKNHNFLCFYSALKLQLGLPRRELKHITLPETNIAPENGWVEYWFPFGAQPIFEGELLVLGSASPKS